MGILLSVAKEFGLMICEIAWKIKKNPWHR